MNNLLDSTKSRHMAQDWIDRTSSDQDYNLHVYLLDGHRVTISKKYENEILFFWNDIGINFELSFTLNHMTYSNFGNNTICKYISHNKDQRPLYEKAVDITLDEFMDKYDEICEEHDVPKIWR